MTHRLGVDVGGTFTDLGLVGPGGRALTRKVLSSTGNYAEAIVRGARELMAAAAIAAIDIVELIHGTAIATNAILERRGARTGLLTTAEFRDLLEIGRLRLARLYDLDFERPAPLVPRGGRGDVFRHVYAGPGGWGDPLTRDPARVRWDVLEEKITLEHARREYGVALDPATLEILADEPARLRAVR